MVRRGLRWFVAVVGAVLAALILGTVLPRPLFDAAAGGGPEGRHILVLSSPIHTDIAVPAEALAGAEFEFLHEAGLPVDNRNARWVLFGWGGKAFYTATPELTDIRLGPLLKSFTLDSSVMHVEVAGAFDEAESFVSAYTISEDGLARLLAFIRATFSEVDGAPVRLPGTGYGESDTFFEAIGSFNAFLGCNTWTAAALREAGLRTGWWNPLPVTLGYSLALYN
jgi:uncharacterized protein (TIGR02117 family)